MKVIYSVFVILLIFCLIVRFPLVFLTSVLALYVFDEYNESEKRAQEYRNAKIIAGIVIQEDNEEDDDDIFETSEDGERHVDIREETKLIMNYFNLRKEDGNRLNDFIIKVNANDFVELLYVLFMHYPFRDVNKQLDIGNFVIWKSQRNDEIYNVYDRIIAISRNRNYSNKVRSTAVDMLIRSNNKFYIEVSKEVLNELRQDEMQYLNYRDVNEIRTRIHQLREQQNETRFDDDDDNMELQAVLENQIGRLRAQEFNLNHDKLTIYSDTQNVHNNNINESVITSAMNLMENIKDDSKSMNVEEELRRYYPDYEKNKNKIEDSLNNIRTNPSQFRNNMTLDQVYTRVVNYIGKSKYKNELVKRLGEELVDMNGLCATGYMSRILNVIQGFPDISDELKISVNPKDEIYASIQTYLNNCIQNDERSDELLDTLISKNYTKEFRNFVQDKMKVKYESLLKEYVASNIIDKGLLDANVQDSLNNYFKNEEISKMLF